MALANSILQYGIRADQPAAAPENNGIYYRVTDEGDLVEQSDGSTWTQVASGSGAGDVSAVGTLTDDAIVLGDGTTTVKTTTTGTGVVTALGVNVGSAGAVVVNGGALGTPSGGTLTNATGLPVASGISGLGTGVATALAINVGSAGAPVVLNGAGGTPSAINLSNATSLAAAALPAATRTRSITCAIDGGGATITTGIKADVQVPYACTITAVTLLADQSGAIVVDIWKETYANYPPTNADSITAAAKPTITASGVKSQDSTLTGWTTAISAGDTLRFNVDSVTSIQRLHLSLTVTV
jgi:hypothetical protein